MGVAGLTVSLWFIVIYAFLSIVWLTIWVITMIHQARRKRWAWFVLTLLFQITTMIYWIVWISSESFRKKKKK